jgi:hypothetical protein
MKRRPQETDQGLRRFRRSWELFERACELRARREPELAEDLVQVVFDRAWADVELRGDLRIRRAFCD